MYTIAKFCAKHIRRRRFKGFLRFLKSLKIRNNPTKIIGDIQKIPNSFPKKILKEVLNTSISNARRLFSLEITSLTLKLVP